MPWWFLKRAKTTVNDANVAVVDVPVYKVSDFISRNLNMAPYGSGMHKIVEVCLLV